MSGAFGQVINPEVIAKLFVEGPGQFLVRKLMKAMSDCPPFKTLFGPYKDCDQNQRWADYQRFDWSVRALPAINVFEAESEDKDSSHGYLTGTLSFQVFWPASMRRSDLTRVPSGFKGALQNFLESEYVTKLLDPLPWDEREDKVPGLNELGKAITWQPNAAGLVEEEEVPVTIVNIRYRILLSSWYAYLENQGRSKAEPFTADKNELKTVGIHYLGVTEGNASNIVYTVDDNIEIQGGNS